MPSATASIRVRLLLRLLLAVFAVAHECPFIVIETEEGSQEGHVILKKSQLVVMGVHTGVITELNQSRFGSDLFALSDGACCADLLVKAANHPNTDGVGLYAIVIAERGAGF